MLPHFGDFAGLGSSPSQSLNIDSFFSKQQASSEVLHPVYIKLDIIPFHPHRTHYQSALKQKYSPWPCNHSPFTLPVCCLVSLQCHQLTAPSIRPKPLEGSIPLYCPPQFPAHMHTKVAIILTELSIPFETTAIWDATELKKAPYTDVNPNGRAPGESARPDKPYCRCMLKPHSQPSRTPIPASSSGSLAP